MTPANRKQFDYHRAASHSRSCFEQPQTALLGTFVHKKRAAIPALTTNSENNGDKENSPGTICNPSAGYLPFRGPDCLSLRTQASTFATNLSAIASEHSNIPTHVSPPLKSAITTSPLFDLVADDDKNLCGCTVTETCSPKHGRIAAEVQSATTRPHSIVAGEPHEQTDSGFVSVAFVGVRESCRYKNRFRQRRPVESGAMRCTSVQSIAPEFTPSRRAPSGRARQPFIGLSQPVSKSAWQNTGWLGTTCPTLASSPSFASSTKLQLRPLPEPGVNPGAQAGLTVTVGNSLGVRRRATHWGTKVRILHGFISNTPRGVRYCSQGTLRKGRKRSGADDRSLAAHSARLAFSGCEVAA
jgi:hypothetical protein